ncbi:MAG: hypothetical protein Q7V05_10575 [Methanoregula sp.]|nr:hypothetical protein [Methanoregula sp.]
MTEEKDTGTPGIKLLYRGDANEVQIAFSPKAFFSSHRASPVSTHPRTTGVLYIATKVSVYVRHNIRPI